MTPRGSAGSGRDDGRPLYPVEAWRIRELGFDPSNAARNETVFSLANGNLGLRGNLEEDAGNVAHGTYLNGFHEEAPIAYGEAAHGFARNHQVLLNVADGKRVRLEVDGEGFDLTTGSVEAHERVLDLRTGLLTRTVRWRSPAGTLAQVVSRRLVSLGRPGLAAIDYAVTALEGGAEIGLTSTLDARVRNQEVSDDPRVGAHLPEGALQTVRCEASGGAGLVMQRTRSTRLAVVAVVRHRVGIEPAVVRHRVGIESAGEPAGALGAHPGEEAAWVTGNASCTASDDGVTCVATARIPPGATLRLTKLLAYGTSLDHPEDELVARAQAVLDAVPGGGFEELAAEQRAILDEFWLASDVEIDGDGAIQQGVRFNLFSIFQSAGRNGRTSLAAKGLTGEGYEGHYFWDTEIFALPFFAYTQPEIARSLLMFRCATLPRARERAAELDEPGALFPWRTINGNEASAYFPAGTAQYHINADIAYAIAKYTAATGDRSLLIDGGAEVVFETARLWAGLGAYIPARGGAFCINEVTGPDEYTALVNNNAYTNLMARFHLQYAARLADELAAQAPDAFRRLADAIALGDDEVHAWRRAAGLMRIPRDPVLGVHAQDDSFLDREPWDFAGTPRERYPLLLHYHPLVIYRHQVLKQSDVVLAQVLLASEFTAAEKRRNYLYYDPLTTGDSSLSPCIQSVAAAELGYADEAYRYFLQTARMDLDDVNGNVEHGVHIAAMAGSWVSLVYGFAGLRDDDGRLRFSPHLPARWDRLAFRLRVTGSVLRVTITRTSARYEVETGEAVELRHFGRPTVIDPGAPVTFDLAPRLAAVIFDLDGVLTDTAEHHYQAWQRLAAKESLPFDRELNERLKGVSRMESLEIILENAGRAAELRDKVRLADRKNAYFAELIDAITPDDVLPGMRQLLLDLRARGIGIAVASMSHNVWSVIRRLGIEGLVDVIVDPASLVKGKPDPEIFLKAAEALGARFEDCTGVEDARAGIAAIRAAGMVAVGVGAGLAEADWAVADTGDLTAESLERAFAGAHATAVGSRGG